MNLLFLSMLLGQQANSSVTIRIDPNKVLHPVSRSLYGIFFEEINQAGEGGLYAELIRNRGMEGPVERGLPQGWVAEPGNDKGSATLDDANPLNDAHPRSIRLGSGAVVNEGFWGIAVKANATYRLDMWVKGHSTLDVALVDGTRKLGSVRVKLDTDQWQRVSSALRPTSAADRARLECRPVTETSNRATMSKTWIGYASLMPVDTWKKRENGMRMDLAQHVAQMAPKFVRFPGGCYVEGGDKLSDAFDWKRSVLHQVERKGLDHSMWGYPNSFGLGYHEYLQWCEDLGASPLFVVNCGMSHKELVPLDQMQPYIQNVLDAIEYANGPETSPWGATRAKNGHPKPFNLKYIEIGNENGYNWSFGGPAAYAARYKLVYDAIKKTHPEIECVADSPVPHPMDIVDEHYYSDPGFFWRSATRYDRYDRKGPKIYVGEYAVTNGCGQGNLAAALGEAAFMTGMERNSEIVTMSSYAPLFVNVNNRQWNPNAIVFDSSRSYGTPSYWVQSLFANNRADVIVQHSIQAPPPQAPKIGGTVGLETWRTKAEFRNVVVEANGREIHPRALPNVIDGAWTGHQGTFTQTDLGERKIALLNGVDLTGLSHYTLKLQARKLAGDEGFIIVTDAKDGTSLNWNVGGWGNTQSAFQRADGILGKPVQGKLIEDNRWYDIRIERDGNHTKAFLDGKLIQELDEQGEPDFAAVVGIDTRANELIIKAVNGATSPRTATLDFGSFVGKAERGAKGKAIILRGESLNDENSFDHPTKIAPVVEELPKWGKPGQYTFAPLSVTILRIPLRDMLLTTRNTADRSKARPQ